MNKPVRWGNAAAIIRAIRGAQILLTPPACSMAGKAAAARDAVGLLDDVARACLRAGIASDPAKGFLAEIEKLRAAIEAEAETLKAWAEIGLDVENETPKGTDL